jgi:hypothetical protein
VDHEVGIHDGVSVSDFASVEIIPQFDFEAHADAAVIAFQRVRSTYIEIANAVKDLLRTCLIQTDIPFHTMESRAKKVESFRRKSVKPSAGNPNEPR